MIDHMTVSFFLENEELPNKSSVKFGSYDPIGLRADKELYMIRTAHKGTWDLRANIIQVGKEKLAEESRIRFEPQLPYLYLPRDYYRVFVKIINKLYSDESRYGTTKVCDESANICRFATPCSKVEKKKIQFGIRMYDEARDIYFNINEQHMYISGEHMGGNKDECYVPVFSNRRQKDSDTNLVYVGNLFL